jgi:hypothetical protein
LEDDLILFIGGDSVVPNARFDVILEKKRQKFHLKYRKVTMATNQGISMNMRCPFSVR